MTNRENDPINELRQLLYPVFQNNGVLRAVAYYNKDRLSLSVDTKIILMVESGLKGMDFCELLDDITVTVNGELLTILDIHHFQQWSEIDNGLALEGTEIYIKEKAKNKINLGYLKEINDAIIKVQQYCKDESYQQFETNSMLCEACEFNLHRIGKLADYIDDTFKQENPQISWNALRGFQGKLTSSYPGTNKLLLWEIIQHDFPELLERVNYIIKAESSENTSD